MRKLAIAAALIASTVSVEAGQRNYQHYPQQYYHHQHHSNMIIGGIVGGLIIGGLIVNQPAQYYYKQPVCQNVFVGNYWNGLRWVRQYQVICN